MNELDDRIADGLRAFIERAPDDADVWADTERHVGRQKLRRRAASGAIVAVVAVAAIALIGAVSANSASRVRVASSDTAPPTATNFVCPTECVGRANADVDGDGRPDQIGLSADPPLSKDAMANRPSKLTVRVAFANGQTAEYGDSADWDASLIGATDLNQDGSAEILYFSFTGANNRMGRILRWNGSQLVAVQGSDGKPFTTFTSGYAMGADGFRCAPDAYIAMTIGDDGVSPTSPSGWSASEIAYRLRGNELLAVGGSHPIAITDPPPGAPSSGENTYIPPEYDDVIGVHCPGVTPGYPYTADAP